MVGIAFEMGPTDKCPECSQPAVTHRLLEPDQCGCFAPCQEAYSIRDMAVKARAIFGNGRDLARRLEGLPKEHDGHPCTLPINHIGRHRNEEASQHCAIVVQAFHEHDVKD
jgi:hypothetical protein